MAKQDYETVSIQLPDWAGRSLDEVGFVQEYLLHHPMIYVDGCFYSRQGRLSQSQVEKEIYDHLSCYYSTSLAKKVHSALEVLKLECRKDRLPLSETKIHCANGCYSLMEESFSQKQDICLYRLPVKYNPQAPRPALWLDFLKDLLEPGDILTLQEYMGYCLLPVNYAQKMLLIIGRGGEGKSRIGIVLSALLGEGMVNGSLTKLESSPFSRADLQGRLLMVDDDLRLEALKSTNYIKSLVTAETAVDVERKGIQSYQARLYCRFLAFGNDNLRSLHDRSHGFFRRQIILTTKPRPKDRIDDPYLGQRLKQELEGILLWCIEGLVRLLTNELMFTITPRAQANLDTAVEEGNNIPAFLTSQGYLRYTPSREISARSLYQLYKDWCDDNIQTPLSPRSFSGYLNQNLDTYGLTYSTNIHAGNGRRVRGYLGVESCHKY